MEISLAKVKIVEKHGYNKIVSKTTINLNEVVFDCYQSSFQTTRTLKTTQVGLNKHIKNKLLDFVNHSCNPNSVFDTSEICFRAIKDIRKGEEITFFYPGAEIILANNFYCNCGSANCLGYIQGGLEMDPKIIQSVLEKGICTKFFKKIFLSCTIDSHSLPNRDRNGCFSPPSHSTCHTSS